MQTIQSNFSIPAVVIGMIDFCHFIPLSLTLTLPGGHKHSTKQRLFGFIFSHTFDLIRMKFDVMKTIQAEHPETTFE